MAAAAERIGEELARAKRNIADSAADTGDDLAAELRRLQNDLNAQMQGGSRETMLAALSLAIVAGIVLGRKL
jgi:hypothetical protein